MNVLTSIAVWNGLLQIDIELTDVMAEWLTLHSVELVGDISNINMYILGNIFITANERIVSTTLTI